MRNLTDSKKNDIIDIEDEINSMKFKTHAQQRLYERYGRELSMDDMRGIKDKLNQQNYLFLKISNKDPNKMFVYVEYKNIPYKVLVAINSNQLSLVTTYPFEVDEYNLLLEKNSKMNKLIEKLAVKG